jgi:hypothetical protein
MLDLLDLPLFTLTVAFGAEIQPIRACINSASGHFYWTSAFSQKLHFRATITAISRILQVTCQRWKESWDYPFNRNLDAICASSDPRYLWIP